MVTHPSHSKGQLKILKSTTVLLDCNRTPTVKKQRLEHKKINKNICACALMVSQNVPILYLVIIILSFLNCDRLLIREVQWFYWTQELLVPVEKFSVRMPLRVRVPSSALYLVFVIFLSVTNSTKPLKPSLKRIRIHLLFNIGADH